MVSLSVPIEILIAFISLILGGIGTIVGWFIHDYVKVRRAVETIRQFLFGPEHADNAGLESQVDNLDQRLDNLEILLNRVAEAMDENGFEVEHYDED